MLIVLCKLVRFCFLLQQGWLNYFKPVHSHNFSLHQLWLDEQNNYGRMAEINKKWRTLDEETKQHFKQEKERLRKKYFEDKKEWLEAGGKKAMKVIKKSLKKE